MGHGLRCGILQENRSSLQRGWSNRSYWWLRTSYHQPMNNLIYCFPPSQAEQHAIWSENEEVQRVAQVHSTSGINPPKFLFLWSPVLTENPSPGTTASSSCSVAGHKIPLKDNESPAKASLKFHSLQPSQVNKVPFPPPLPLLNFLLEKGRGETLAVFLQH